MSDPMTGKKVAAPAQGGGPAARAAGHHESAAASVWFMVKGFVHD
jgi:hypothetical protein